jgi:hypothetical protein
MATFDYFIGALSCPACGSVIMDASANMQTKLSKHPSLRDLAVGDKIDADWRTVGAAGYLTIAEPKQADTIAIIETWECPKCDKPFNWAIVAIVGGKIARVESIELSADLIHTANYIAEDCRFLLNAPTRPEMIVEVLLQQLQNA